MCRYPIRCAHTKDAYAIFVRLTTVGYAFDLALLPITESYLDLSAQDLEFGFNETRRDRILRTYVRNAYYFHLNEIFSTLKNEYTDWDRPVQNPLNVRDATLEVHLLQNMFIIKYIYNTIVKNKWIFKMQHLVFSFVSFNFRGGRERRGRVLIFPSARIFRFFADVAITTLSRNKLSAD